MIAILGWDGSVSMIIYLLLSFTFFIGILLIVSQESFIALNKALQNEYGLKRRLTPKVEDTHIDVIDKFLIKHRVLAGLFISVCAFVLLLIYK